jgi:hypothetical protein
LKILKFFDADLGSGIFLTLNPGFGDGKIQIRDKHWTNVVFLQQKVVQPTLPAVSKPVVQFGTGKNPFLPRAIQVQLIKAKGNTK